MDQDKPHHLGEVAVLEVAELHVLLQEKDSPVTHTAVRVCLSCMA